MGTYYCNIMMRAQQHLIVSLLVFILAFEASSASPSPSIGAKMTKEKQPFFQQQGLNNNKDYDFTCETCKIFMIVVKDQLANPANEQAIADALRQVCSIIFPDDPVNFANCDTMIQEYTDDIIELLINQYLEPEAVCQFLNFCPATIQSTSSLIFHKIFLQKFSTKKNSNSNNNIICEGCKDLVELVDSQIASPENEIAISNALRSICDLVFPNHENVYFAQCDTLFADYTDDIIEMIVNQYLNPKIVCEKLQLCPTTN